MKRALIISYYWPPSGGGGVQRWLKMSAFMRSNGWEPIVYTPENPAFDVKDASLIKDVDPSIEIIKKKIFEPVEVFQSAFKLIGKKPPQQKDFISDRNASFFQRFATYLRGNYFIPDPRVTWVVPSLKFLKDYLKKHPVDAIITTGPPHSMHLIGLNLKKKFPNLVWVSDFRDPWSEWDLLDVLKTKERARRKHQALERKVLQNSDLVISISPYHVERLIALGAKRCELINNGYDARDFEGTTKQRTDYFLIRHLGSVDELRDPRPFVLALKSLLDQRKIEATDLKIEFIGPVNNAFRDFIKEKELDEIISFHPAVPHSSVVGLYRSSTLLLLILAHSDIAAGNMPGKMYEYMASGTPIFGIGPENGDAAALIHATSSGRVMERSNQNAMEEMLLKHYLAWKNDTMLTTKGAPDYSREALTQKFCKLLDNLINN